MPTLNTKGWPRSRDESNLPLQCKGRWAGGQALPACMHRTLSKPLRRSLATASPPCCCWGFLTPRGRCRCSAQSTAREGGRAGGGGMSGRSPSDERRRTSRKGGGGRQGSPALLPSGGADLAAGLSSSASPRQLPAKPSPSHSHPPHTLSPCLGVGPVPSVMMVFCNPEAMTDSEREVR